MAPTSRRQKDFNVDPVDFKNGLEVSHSKTSRTREGGANIISRSYVGGSRSYVGSHVGVKARARNRVDFLSPSEIMD